MARPSGQLQEDERRTSTLIDRLVDEHERIHLLFDAFVVAPDDDKSALLQELVGAIVKHEIAEEVVLYPAAFSAGARAECLEGRLEEQFALEAMLHRLGRLEIGSPAFEALFLELERNVHLHSIHEERTVLEPLRRAVSREALDELEEQYTVVRAAAPQHPYPDGHPTKDSSSARVRGGLLALLRGVRDRLRRTASERAGAPPR